MKRFYKAVAVEQVEDGWRVTLDGRGIKTAGGRPQVVPTQALAEAMAEERRRYEENLQRIEQLRERSAGSQR